MNIRFVKFILLFAVMLFIKHSIAQSGITIDSVKEIHNRLTSPSIAEPTKTYIYHTPLKKEIVKDSIEQPTINTFTFGEDNIMLAKDSILQSKKTSDTLIKAVKLVDKIAEHSTIPLNTTKNIDTAYLLEIVIPSITQSTVTFDAGQVFSTFKFIDSQGNKKNFTNNITGCFSLGYLYALRNGLFVRTNLGMRKAGASMIYEGLNVSWTIQYADADLGIGYMLNKKRLKPYFSISPYFGYMLKGNQIIGIDYLDIKNEKSMKTTDIGLFFSPGLQIALSNYVACYAECKYILGIQNLETSIGQKSFNRGFLINLGVSIAIEKYKFVAPKNLSDLKVKK